MNQHHAEVHRATQKFGAFFICFVRRSLHWVLSKLCYLNWWNANRFRMELG